MEIEIKLVSREMIKPSNPTPPHLKSHKFTLLDQAFSLLEYSTPSVLFYAGGTPCSVSRLRDSLSKTLSLFYPLAGRLAADACSIHCTDGGVPFVVAEANCSLSAFLAVPNRVDWVDPLLPDVDPTRMATGLVPLILQVSVFDCGGFAIGCQILHKTLDGISRTHFFRTWAGFAAGREREVVGPNFTAAISLFPPPAEGGEAPTSVVEVLRRVEEGGCVVRAFGFSAAAIGVLQAKGRSENVPNPTRVESVSGFLWKHLMEAAIMAGPSLVIHSVDMRPHLRPPLPPTTFGKFTTHAFACYDDSGPVAPDLPHLIGVLRRAISAAKDPISVSKFQGERGEEAVHQHRKKYQKLKKQIRNAYIFTSWSDLDVDFGSGMPLWMGFCSGPTTSWFRNFVPLIHTPDYGIEAWLVLDQQEMANLESNPEFLAFASPVSSSGSIFPPRSLL